MLFYTASGERMRIDAAGNVGIGTDSPSHKLTVSRATEAAAYQININNDGGISNGNFTGIRFSQGAGGTTELGNIKLHYYSTGATDLSFGTRYDTQAIYIKNGGNVGIGTTSPVGKLDVALLNTRRFIVTYDDSLVTIKGASDTGAGENLRIIGDNLIFNTSSAGSGSERMRITSAGNVGINTTAPQQLLHVLGATNGYAMIQGASDSGQAGIYFKKEDTTGTMDRTKGLIVFHTNVGSGWGRGNLGFCLNSADSNAVVSVSDEKFRMVDNGDFLADGDVVDQRSCPRRNCLMETR
jgi:hypothetical protein